MIYFSDSMDVSQLEEGPAASAMPVTALGHVGTAVADPVIDWGRCLNVSRIVDMTGPV